MHICITPGGVTEMDNSEEKVFECLSQHFKNYMVRTEVKKAFPYIPCEPDIYEAIAYASGFTIQR